ncbi:MAG: hypothetical protein K2M19_07445, partial [Muribaculaceae bacterium]|nr:hypothetical protein [Muribaculaceae bacterium]
TCTFTTPDPLAYKFTTVSPYSNTPGNPANLADYDGMRSIFSTEGQFLGVDETGFKGNYVMMNKGDYNPNMTTAEVDKVALTNKGIDDSIIKNIEKQIEGFKTRPDYDGYITFAEATDWYRAGSGETLYADITKLDFSAIELSKVSASEFTYPNLSLTSLVSCIGICGLGYNPTIPNTSDALALSSWMNTQFKEGLTYGHIGLKRNTNGSIYAAPDEYDFGMHEDSFFRNVATKFGEAFAGKGTSFKIEFYGFINK